jgi:protein involved in polysaccharide export with SLBB domain
VTIGGEVKRPMRYELLDKETLADLITHSGGLTTKAYTGLISVNRLSEKGNERKIIDVSLDSLISNKKGFMLQDGDILDIHSKREEVFNFLTIDGAVNMAGTYELRAGDRVSNLIKKANGLTPDANKEQAFLVRYKPDLSKEYIKIDLAKVLLPKPDLASNILLQKGDVLSIISNQTFVDKFNVVINGMVRKPGTFEYSEHMTLSDLILMAGGLKEEANKEKVFLVRTHEDLNKEFLTIALKDVLDSLSPFEKRFPLFRGDVFTIVSKSDLIDNFSVNAIGLFKKPGNYDFSNGMTLSDLIYLAGGFKLEADPMRIEVTRTSFFSEEYKIGEASKVIVKSIQLAKGKDLSSEELNYKLNPFDQVFIRMVPDFEYQRNFSIYGEVKYPGVYAISNKEEHLSEIIKRAGGLNKFAFPEGATLFRKSLPGGYLVMNLKKALKNNRSEYNYIINEEDVLEIPKIIDLIAIRGSVQYLELTNGEQINAPYVAGRRANFYVKEFSNGFGDHSWKRKTYVIDHNHKINRTKYFLLFKIYPKVNKGATVFVINKPPKEKKEKKEEKPIDWNKSISDFTVKLTGLATLYILLKAAGVKF